MMDANWKARKKFNGTKTWGFLFGLCPVSMGGMVYTTVWKVKVTRFREINPHQFKDLKFRLNFSTEMLDFFG